MTRSIHLRGMNGPLKGQIWEATELLRVGRLETLEVVLEDSSVSRYHAEIRATDRGWRVRDLGSTNGTRLNGVRLGSGQWPLRIRDLLQFGEVAVVVEHVTDEEVEITVPMPLPASEPVMAPNAPLARFTDSESLRGTLVEDRRVRTPVESKPTQPIAPAASAPIPDSMLVAGTSKATWNEAVEGLAFDSNRCPRAGEQLLVLLRAGHHLVHMEKEDDLLQSILNDAVAVLDAQRGAIVLAEPPDNRLKIKAITTGRAEPRASMAGRTEPSGRFQFSQSLATRCFSRGESILCHSVEEDPELALARSIAEGAMGSVLCVLLRTPRKTLGVLHLDRSPWQKPFTMEDLHLSDALSAHVSAGIECAQLLRKQRDLFLDTITILAQAVELRDEYTGGHTFRVTTYSILLAEYMNLAPADVDLIRIGTPLHDIGKIGIDDAILRKPDRLTPEEFEVMKSHTVKGAEIIATVPDLRTIIPIVRSHHERWDGRGYPDGLGGEAISPLARIVALADAFDAMTSDRPYRKGMAPEVAFAEIEKQAGKQFDPTFAAGFLAMREHILQELSSQGVKEASMRNTRILAPV